MEKEQLYREMLARYRSQINNGGYDIKHVEQQLDRFIAEEGYLKAEATKRALQTLRNEIRSKELN